MQLLSAQSQSWDTTLAEFWLVRIVSHARFISGLSPLPLKRGSLALRLTAFPLATAQTFETKLCMCFVLQGTRTFPTSVSDELLLVSTTLFDYTA